MVPMCNVLKKLLSVNNCVINSYEFVTDDNGVTTLKVFVRPHKHHSNLCPICGKKCSVYDRNQHCRMQYVVFLYTLFYFHLIINSCCSGSCFQPDGSFFRG